MPVRLSYITADGDEIVLDDDEHSFARELTGRTGFEAPAISIEKASFGDGTEKIISIKKEGRSITCFFWADATVPGFEQRLSSVKKRLIQTGSRISGNWGKLRIRKPTGECAYLSCVYTGGLDKIVRDISCRMKFTLTFEATDSLFYSDSDTTHKIQTEVTSANSLFFSTDLYFEQEEPLIYLVGANHKVEYNLDLDCAEVYPTIRIYGPCSNVILRNETTNKVIHVDKTVKILKGNFIEVQTAPMARKARLIKRSGESESVLSKLTADSNLNFPIVSGKNLLTFWYGDGDPSCYAELTFRKGYFDL